MAMGSPKLNQQIERSGSTLSNVGDYMFGAQGKHLGDVGLLDPSQQNYLSQILGGQSGEQAHGALGNLLQNYDEDFFQKSVIDPSMKSYREQILPEVQQGFAGAGAGSSSAFNQTLARSAQELASSLAGKRLDLQQNVAQRQAGGLGVLGSALGQKTFEPMIQGPSKGLIGDILTALGSVAGGMIK